jgi:hypothetical protein
MSFGNFTIHSFARPAKVSVAFLLGSFAAAGAEFLAHFVMHHIAMAARNIQATARTHTNTRQAPGRSSSSLIL